MTETTTATDDGTEPEQELDRDSRCKYSMTGSHNPLVSDEGGPVHCFDCQAPLKPLERDESFTRSTDAMEWSRAFMARLRAGLFDDPGEGIDEGLMVGWFANAMAAQERALRESLPAVQIGVADGTTILAPLTGTHCELDVVPLAEPSLLVLHTHGVEAGDLGYVTASLQQLIDRLKPHALAAIVLDQEGQTVEALDPAQLRAIGLRFTTDDDD